MRSFSRVFSELEQGIGARKLPGWREAAYFLKVVLMNITLYPLLAAWTLLGIVLFPPAFLMVKLISGLPADRVMRKLVWVYGKGWLLLFSPFVRFAPEGLEKMTPGRPRIVVLNHLSFFDTYCVGLFPFDNVVFAVRSWPFKIPFYRPFMHLARYLNVEGYDWDTLVGISGELLEEGSTLLFFPEGHRSPDGRIRRFYSGAFKLAVDAGVEVVPICITGTDDLLPPGRWWLGPARVGFRVLDPVDPGEFSGESAHVEFRKKVKAMMVEEIGEMTRQGESG